MTTPTIRVAHVVRAEGSVARFWVGDGPLESWASAHERLCVEHRLNPSQASHLLNLAEIEYDRQVAGQ